MKKILLVIFLGFVCHSSFAQSLNERKLKKKVKSVIDNEESYFSWGCGIAGRVSENVQILIAVLQNKKHEYLFSFLDSKNPANKYLAATSFEILSKDGKITLKQNIQQKIKQLYSSTDTIYVCSGCSYHEDRTVSDLLNAEEEELISLMTRNKVKYYINQSEN